MFQNYLKIALRNLWKHKAFSFINVSGLAVGMACCLLIVLFIQDELRYDRFHERADEIYRVTMDVKLPGAEFGLATTMPPLGPAMLADFPEVTQATRISRNQSVLTARGERRFFESSFFFADSSFLDVFTFPLVRGDPRTALAAPFSLVLTEETARKYFGTEDPMGQVLTLYDEYDFTVTGILAPIPSASHLQFDVLASLSSQPEMDNTDLEEWSSISGAITYVVLAEPQRPQALEARLPDFLRRHMDEGGAAARTLHLQPLERIRLYSDYLNEDAYTGNVTRLYIFASIAALILLIASINFVNLATARSANRTREVGMRKVMGAYRAQLIRQFLGESVLLACIALVCALALVEVLLPLFNYLLGKDLTPGYFSNPALLGALVAIAGFVGVVAGCYPAFVLSAFRPVEVLKGHPRNSLLAALFRRGLVVVQFCIAIVLIIGSVTMAAQMAYFAEKDLGFDHEQVVVVPMRDEVAARYETLKNAVRQHPGVVQVAAASNTPGQNSYSLTTYTPGGTPDADGIGIRTIFIDYEFAETFGLAFTAGRNFSPDFPADSSASVILNEAAVRLLGWTEDPLGQTLTYDDDRTAAVVGVLRDFHFSTLQQEIAPIVFRLQPDVFRYLAVRIRAEQTTATLAALEDTWRAFAPAYPFEYSFVDDDFASEYDSIQRLSETIRAFALLAVLVACLGLFGLVAYTTEQRTKEIGVRKVLGASVPGILALLSRDFLKLVVVAFAVAVPLAYMGMSRWLDDFAYRIELGWAVFALAGGAALAVALLTMTYQALKAALANPVQSLRHE